MATRDQRRNEGATPPPVPDENVTEINHRIASGLQLVSTFLSLQEREVTDVSAKKILKAASTRVAAIGKVQRALMPSPSRAVALGGFLGALCTDVETLTGLDITTQIADVVVTAVQAQHLGIAINELLLDAAARVFGGCGGQVVVSCRRSSRGFLLVTVTDNGRRPPAAVSPEDDPSISMTILRSVVGQLEGELTLRSRPAVTAKLKFPIKQGSISKASA